MIGTCGGDSNDYGSDGADDDYYGDCGGDYVGDGCGHGGRGDDYH